MHTFTRLARLKPNKGNAQHLVAYSTWPTQFPCSRSSISSNCYNTTKGRNVGKEFAEARHSSSALNSLLKSNSIHIDLNTHAGIHKHGLRIWCFVMAVKDYVHCVGLAESRFSPTGD